MKEADSIEAIRSHVMEAFRKGKLSSYERKPPTGEALELLAQARVRLKCLIKDVGESLEALRLLALIQESLFQYASAIKTLETVVSRSSKPDRNDLKRLAMCRQALIDLQKGGMEDEDA